MTKIAYEEWAPKPATLKLVDKANEIIAEYEADDYDLTLRQLYYQFVSRDLLENKQTEYKRLGAIISQARRAGLISWDAIVDRTRNLKGFSSWETPQDIIESAAASFKIDPWERQDWRVEVWFEKEALLGVFERACQEYRIPYFACRGNVSDSEMWSAARRLKRSGKDVLILHFGDHDPSGVDMTRDITDRLALFRSGHRTEVRRIALNMDQIEEYQPPPNPAKESDSRFARYQEQFGDESWELDALDPRTLSDMVQREVADVVDMAEWRAALAREENAREDLELVARRLPDMVSAARSGRLARAGAPAFAERDSIAAMLEGSWLPIVYQDGGDLKAREVGFEGSTLVLRMPGEDSRQGQTRFDDAEGLLAEVGGTVWHSLAAYRDGVAWHFSDVLMTIMDAKGDEE